MNLTLRCQLLHVDINEGCIAESKERSEAGVKKRSKNSKLPNSSYVANIIEEGVVGVTALERVGKNKNLKGIVHECMRANMYNKKLSNRISGRRMVFSLSKNDPLHDLLVVSKGEVIYGEQLKDTVKSTGITFRQILDGKYKGSKLVLTEETYIIIEPKIKEKILNGTAIDQEIESSGISSKDTSRIAGKTLGDVKKISSAEVIIPHMVKAGLSASKTTAVIEAVIQLPDLIDGNIDGKEYVANIVKESMVNGVSVGVGAGASEIVIAGTALFIADTTAPIWIPVVAGLIAFSIVSRFVGNTMRNLIDAVA